MTGDAPSPGQGPGPADESRPAAPAVPLALYRRYRPASFAEVKGQDHVTEPLRQALRSGRVNHAYLFSGPRGCGKTSSARILARSLNCEQGPTPDPCGVCASCVSLAPAGPGSIDVIEIDAASHGGVDDARDLRERAFYAPVSGRFKIYIIDEAHMVTREGFNALLKLVEEPPPHLKFVFATTEPEKVIATIRSRTHHYPFRLVPPAVLRELLEQILASEDVAYEPAVLPVVIRAGAGSVRDSLSVLDQLIAGSDESGLTYARAIALLGYTDDRLLDEVARAFAARGGAAVFGAINRVVEGGHDPRRFAADLLDRLRDLIVLAAVPDAVSTGLLDVPTDRLDEMRGQAEGFGQAALTRAAEIVSAGLVEMRGATSPRLLLELMCAQVLVPGAGDAELLSRVERLERSLESGAPPALATRPARSSDAPATRPRSEPAPEPAAPALPAPAPVPASAAAAPASPAPASPAPASPAAAPVSPGSASPGSASPAEAARAAPDAASPRAGSEPPPAGSPGSSPPDAAPPDSAPPDSDAGLLQARWPDILEAVRGERKVAWILLTNATVTSLADGVLTVEFAREGDAKGFVTSGCDGVLGGVLQRMFGISPQLKATARTPGSGTVGPQGPGAGQGRGMPGGDNGSGGLSDSGGPGVAGGASGAERFSGAGGTGRVSGAGGAGDAGGASSASGADSVSGTEQANGAERVRGGGGSDAGSAGGVSGAGRASGTGQASGAEGVRGAGGRGAEARGADRGSRADRGSGTAGHAGRDSGASEASGTGDDGAVGGSGAPGGPDGPRGSRNEPSAARDDPAPGWDGDPRDDDGGYDGGDYGGGMSIPQDTRAGSHPAPDAARPLTGKELIERELGGRIISDLGEA